ncbi:DUF3775 domain-containing protein [Paenibacillus contaminans]|uniref:Uncharacterized protein n=1 Tax=Paenibacillus contaminans TaxID=450362 RepID=A0A329MQL5_9BACL|nr:DUF3775 domain-containing protein [Paenibacillus contaminans]RAV22229.1 hypothetical protein DQG23_04560 [Paenibacillus contaminans]
MSVLLAKMKSLVPHVHETIRLAHTYNHILQLFDRNYEGDPDSVEAYIASLQDEGIIESQKAFKDYLMQLPHSDLVIIQAIMYIGRDENLDDEDDGSDYGEYEFREEKEEVSPQKMVFDYIRFLKGEKDKEVIILHMLEKSPLTDYLSRGLHILNLA